MKGFGVLEPVGTRTRYSRDGPTQGFRANISLKGHLRSHPGRTHGSSSDSEPGQRAVGDTVGRRARVKGAILGGLIQKRCRWRRAGLQEAEHILHGVQGDHAGWPWGVWGRERECEKRVIQGGEAP